MKLVITFRNGAQIAVDVDSFETGRHPGSGGLVKLDWTTPGSWQSKLHHVDLAEVMCLHAERDPATPEASRG